MRTRGNKVLLHWTSAWRSVPGLWFDAAVLAMLLLIFCVRRHEFLAAAARTPEFLNRGNLARDLIDGLKSPLLLYRGTSYHGDVTLIGLITAPFFVLFGDSVGTLFAASQSLSFLTVFLIYYFTKTFFSRPAACVAAFIYVTAPEFYHDYYTYACGMHVDVAFFSLLVFSGFCVVFCVPAVRQVYTGTTRVAKPQVVLFIGAAVAGLISGFAAYVCLTFVWTLGVIIGAWLWLDRHMFRRPVLYIFIVACITGFLPFLMTHVSPQGLTVTLPADIGTGRLTALNFFLSKGHLVIKTAAVLNAMLRQAFALTDMRRFIGYAIPRELWYITMLMCLIFGCGYGIYDGIRSMQCSGTYNNRHPRQTVSLVIVVVYVTGLIALYLLYPLREPYLIYLMPAYPFVAVLMGMVITRLWSSRKHALYTRSLGMAFLAITLYGGFAYTGGMLYYYGGRERALCERQKGYSFSGVSHWMWAFSNGDFMRNDLLSVTMLFRMPAAEHWLRSVVQSGFCRGDICRDYSLVETRAATMQPPMMISLGILSGDFLASDSFPGLRPQIIACIPEKNRIFFYEGIAISYVNRMFHEVAAFFADGTVDHYIPDEMRHIFYLEFGRRIAEHCRGDYAVCVTFAEQCPVIYRGYMYRGFVSGLNLRHTRGWINMARLVPDRFFAYYCGMVYGLGGKRIVAVSDAYHGDYLRGAGERAYTQKHLAVIGQEIAAGQSDVTAIVTAIAGKVFADDEALGLTEIDRQYFTEGIGTGCGLYTFGMMRLYGAVVDEAVPAQWRPAFCRGYGRGIALRYGWNRKAMSRLVRTYIPQPYQTAVVGGWSAELQFLRCAKVQNNGSHEGAALSEAVRQKATALFNEALRQRRNGNIEVALSEVLAGLQLDDTNAGAHELLASIYDEQALYEKAVDEYTKALRLHGHYPIFGPDEYGRIDANRFFAMGKKEFSAGYPVRAADLFYRGFMARPADLDGFLMYNRFMYENYIKQHPLDTLPEATDNFTGGSAALAVAATMKRAYYEVFFPFLFQKSMIVCALVVCVFVLADSFFNRESRLKNPRIWQWKRYHEKE